MRTDNWLAFDGEVSASLGTVLDGERYSDEALVCHYGSQSILTSMQCNWYD